MTSTATATVAITTFVAVALVACMSPCHASTAAASDRVTVPFDYGWRFKLYDPPNESPACAFDTDITGYVCDETGMEDMHYTPQGRVDENDCRLDCCARDNCYSWAYVNSPWKTACYVSRGPKVNCTKPANPKDANVIFGGMRKSVPPHKTSYTYSDPKFDDSDWKIVDAPHDSVVNNSYSEIYDNRHGSLARNVTWYRKHFRLPSDWKGMLVALQFDAIFHVSDIWVNGHHFGPYYSGYIDINFRIDNLTDINFGDEENVISIRADPSFGSGHWYEGGGLYRSCRLVATPLLRIVPYGIYASPEGTGSPFKPTVQVHNGLDADQGIIGRFVLTDANGKTVASADTSAQTLPADNKATLTTSLDAKGVEAWTVRSPTLYTLTVSIHKPGSNETLDLDRVSVGFRKTRWDPDTGFYLNDEHVHLHGFCHHEDFAGVGVAVPDRINLYRLQSLRAVGGNAFRTSHNPYRPSLYDMMDRLGILVWDEARDYTAWNTPDMAAMVKRDRNHPSVIIWSFCNEIECHQDLPGDNSTQFMFRKAAKDLDPDRPTSYNWVNVATDVIDLAADVHGISHYNSDTYKSYHSANPDKPMVSSECCSCETQRDENNKENPSVFFTNFDGQCLQQQVSWTDTLSFVAGTMGIWTLWDYYGEPGQWPHISSSFGQFDLTGVPKSHAFWYRAWWLCHLNASDAGRPLDKACNDVRIVETWDPQDPPKTIHVFSAAHSVELLINGASQGSKTVSFYGFAEFDNITFKPGKVTAIARDDQGKQLANTTIVSPGEPADLLLTLDVPTPVTGTGSAVVLDGHDAALVRATIVDKDGNRVTYANDTVTFKVVSGPGRIIGVGNGDPASHQPNAVDYRDAYHGIARAVVQVTEDCMSPERDVIQHVDVDGGARTKVMSSCPAKPEPIVIQATAGSFTSKQLEITVSTDDADGPLAVAASQPSSFGLLDHYNQA